jgi:uncharacterized lipoprotein YbaY
MKLFILALPVFLAAAMLAGCPQSKVPDTPPMVPQPKASRMAHDGASSGHWQLSRIAAP